MKKKLLTCFLAVITLQSWAQKSPEIPIKKVIEIAEQQFSDFVKIYPDTTRYMRSTKTDGTLGLTSASDWTSGFFPGNLWYMYLLTGDKKWEQLARKWTQGIETNRNNTRTHDLGFMMFDSFGLGYQITKDPAYKPILLDGAKALSTRFHPEVAAIRSWDNPKFTYPVIVDNLMNLEFLFWATKQTGDSSYYKIAVQHADTDLKYRFRPDNSSYHVLDFNPATGKLLKRMTHQGYADETCWARGQAWAIYGYTTLYRETKDKKYLDQAVKAADYFLMQTDKISDHIPYWDFQAPDIPNAPRDASAAAITASGLFELSKYVAKDKNYFIKAKQLLSSLTSDKYLAKHGTNNYFLTMHSTGHKPNGSEIDVPIVYADYYLLEALYRLKNYSTISF